MMKELIEKVLNIPVLDEPNPLLIPSATYENYYIQPSLIGNGRTSEQTYFYDVNIWCKKRAEAQGYAKTLASALENERKTIPSIEFDCDAATKLWRANLKFEQIEDGE